MRNFVLMLAFVVSAILCSAPPAAGQDRKGFLEGFGGLRVGTAAVTDTGFGGVLGASLTPNIQVIGEAGRLGDVLPNTLSTLFALSPVDYRLSAWYGQGGVRLTTGSRSAIGPYVEASAGFARLRHQLNGIGSPLVGALTDAGLRLLDRTEPMASIGGGVVFQGGAFVADAGYRHRRIFASDVIGSVLGGGRFETNEIRFGIGFRF